ncbi:uncharacterized protein CANTADRAFT_91788 [Suhomyces tanzawaensis NRRL Y-17324]|uniref:RAVE subunit 2/Rogdi n=1 Tax=Suhomyces tanzawaensis NRRL Y-17324 TaxID=984487 RepID=A0A1E4SCZ2_9ASCO|nr:uncharacterized protein CANTADRAFT_91788 [Suhomyces tanzawaensis NRRL Y-17324]ODV77336.1 hypothetical protein CANTADRAFT_91788 [Suhomyces tanzawaensis NRRL Y-17324]
MTLLGERQHSQADQDLHWYTSNVVTPEFPQIIEALQICCNLLIFNSPQEPDEANRIERGPAIKLPFSTNKLEALKGIIVRDGQHVTKMSLAIRDSHFKTLHRLTLKEPILLAQIVTAKDSVEKAIAILRDLAKGDDCSTIGHQKLIESFSSLLHEIQIAKSSLQLPTDPSLVFPVNVTPLLAFEPELPPTVAIDLYISQAEVCVDLKSLHRVTERPWGDITPTGLSYIDKIRDEMKLPSSHTTPGAISVAATPVRPASPLNVSEIEDRLNQLTQSSDRSHEGSRIFSNVISHLLLKPKLEPIDYVTKCITYNNMVVMINKKIEVSSPDPVLVSAFTKLDSVEYLISSFLVNLECLLN